MVVVLANRRRGSADQGNVVRRHVELCTSLSLALPLMDDDGDDDDDDDDKINRKCLKYFEM